jgi:hypothetical protein
MLRKGSSLWHCCWPVCWTSHRGFCAFSTGVGFYTSCQRLAMSLPACNHPPFFLRSHHNILSLCCLLGAPGSCCSLLSNLSGSLLRKLTAGLIGVHEKLAEYLTKLDACPYCMWAACGFLDLPKTSWGCSCQQSKVQYTFPFTLIARHHILILNHSIHQSRSILLHLCQHTAQCICTL